MEMEAKALLMNGAQSSFNEWTWAHRLGLMMGMEPKALSKSYYYY